MRKILDRCISCYRNRNTEIDILWTVTIGVLFTMVQFYLINNLLDRVLSMQPTKDTYIYAIAYNGAFSLGISLLFATVYFVSSFIFTKEAMQYLKGIIIALSIIFLWWTYSYSLNLISIQDEISKASPTVISIAKLNDEKLTHEIVYSLLKAYREQIIVNTLLIISGAELLKELLTSRKSAKNKNGTLDQEPKSKEEIMIDEWNS